MSSFLHRLEGCGSVPLANYLKALGVFRLICEQADPSARGWWQDEQFCLFTHLDRTAIEEFFLITYSPTPFVSPWNKGSGFYQAVDAGMSPLADSVCQRFAGFREGIAAGRSQLASLTAADALVRAIKDRTKAKKGMTNAEKIAAQALKGNPEYRSELAAAERKFKELKSDLFTPCRLLWRGQHRAWMDAAVVLPERGKPEFPSLLGTGGNDGRLDFTNNAMQRLNELFDLSAPDGAPRPESKSLLQHALWQIPTSNLAPKAAIGQFLPGSAGGPNSTTAPDGDSLVNPWDFVLMLEGAILFTNRATKRLDPNSYSRASSPFVVRSHTTGYGTPGQEKADRGEQWMPLWSRPCTLADLSGLLGDARVQVGRQTANRPIDVARAIARLGVARGIDAFTRFGYLERNGQSKIAVPLGRIDVCCRPRARLIDDLALWLDRLQRAARDKNAPSRLVQAEHILADAVFATLTHDDNPALWQSVLIAAVGVESIQATGTGIAARPIPLLSPDWVSAANDFSPEFRLALALGSAAGGYAESRRPIDPVRHHWLPLEPGARHFNITDKRLALDPRVVITGRDALLDCSAIIERRLVEAAAKGRRRLPLVSARSCDASLSDLARLISGDVDITRTFVLARALMAVDWAHWKGDRTLRTATSPRIVPDEAWLTVRLACLPWALDDARDIPVEPSIIRRLRSGDGTSAVALARARLSASGIRSPLQSAIADPQTARRWLATLAFPISRTTARRAAAILAPNLTGARND